MLTEDEVFLDIDPGKVALRFPPQERARKFGTEGTTEYDRNLNEHRAVVVNKLVALTDRFIVGIRQNLQSFPPSLARLLRTMYTLLMSSGRCADQVWNLQSSLPDVAWN